MPKNLPLKTNAATTKLSMPDYSSRDVPLTVGEMKVMLQDLDDHLRIRLFDGAKLERLEDEEPVFDHDNRAVLLPIT